MSHLQEMMVGQVDECLELIFDPNLPLAVVSSLPLPEKRTAQHYTLNEFPVYGNKIIRIRNEVFAGETQREYITRVAQHLGNCVVTPRLSSADL